MLIIFEIWYLGRVLWPYSIIVKNKTKQIANLNIKLISVIQIYWSYPFLATLFTRLEHSIFLYVESNEIDNKKFRNILVQNYFLCIDSGYKNVIDLLKSNIQNFPVSDGANSVKYHSAELFTISDICQLKHYI